MCEWGEGCVVGEGYVSVECVCGVCECVRYISEQ